MPECITLDQRELVLVLHALANEIEDCQERGEDDKGLELAALQRRMAAAYSILIKRCAK